MSGLQGKKLTGYILSVFCLACLSLLFTGCATEVKKASGTRFMMDTLVQIDVYGPDEKVSQEAVRDAMAIMQRLTDKTDRYNTSEVALVNANAGVEPVKVSSDILAMADFVKKQSQAQVDITLGALIDVWNSGRDSKTLPAREQIENVLALSGMQNLLLDEHESTLYLQQKGMSLDLGAIAKGYAVKQAAELLAQNGKLAALVNGGGNIAVVGGKPDGKPWLIGVQDPLRPNETIGTLKLKGGDAVATSGSYQRYYEVDGKRYHHLLSPATGQPVDFNLSATAVIQDAFLADYYSTLLFLLPTRQALEFAERTDGLRAIIVGSDKVVYISSDLKDDFTKNEESAWSFSQG